jgi:serine-type D-Ala-D-Ala carboxypeptidase/endopeptidase
MTKLCGFMIFLVAMISFGQRFESAAQGISDEEIRTALAERIDNLKKSVGMVVGIVTPLGTRIISYGKSSKDKTAAVDENTIFEIGGVTEIFTGLLLADMTVKGEVSLDEPVNKFLPTKSGLHKRNGSDVTFFDLATHTSGLPFLPPDIKADDIRAFADYHDDQLYKFAGHYKIEPASGLKWRYSHVGYGILAKALANRAGVDFSTLVKQRITDRLGMKNTSIHLTEKQKLSRAKGHDKMLNIAPFWSAPSFEGATSMRSSARDLVLLIKAYLTANQSSIRDALKLSLETGRPGPNFEQALGWRLVFSESQPTHHAIAIVGGKTWGCSSFIAMDEETKSGVVVLSNCSEDHGGLGWTILRSLRFHR